MNRPCRIQFHDDAAPDPGALPERYRPNLIRTSYQGVSSYSLLAQHAFYIDFASHILRTRIGGKDDDPVDFPMDSISHIEWFYGNNVPSPLVPFKEPDRARPRVEGGI